MSISTYTALSDLREAESGGRLRSAPPLDLPAAADGRHHMLGVGAAHRNWLWLHRCHVSLAPATAVASRAL